MNNGISEINRFGVCNREQLDSLVESVVQSIDEGSHSAVEAMAMLKKMEYLTSTIKKGIKESLLHELDNHEKEFTQLGVQFTKGSVRTEYDYSNCGHERYNEIIREMDNLKQEKKDLETFLKTIKEGNGVADVESGIVLNPPIKRVTDGVKLSFK